MTDDEMTVLLIVVEGESLAPIGRWEQPILSLTERGLMKRNDAVNYVITDKGRVAVAQEEKERDDDFRQRSKSKKCRQQLLNCGQHYKLGTIALV